MNAITIPDQCILPKINPRKRLRKHLLQGRRVKEGKYEHMLLRKGQFYLDKLNIYN